jgi:uncharacterized RDD family membrane protein YckC
MSLHHLQSSAETFDQVHASQELNVNVMGRRVVATLLDCIPLGIITWIVDSTFGITQKQSALPTLAGIPFTSSISVALPWLYLVLVTYYTVQETLFSTTFGKFLMGLKVVRNDGGPLIVAQALVRNLVRPIDAGGDYLLGWVLALCSSRRRRLGDHLARTMVVSADSVPTTSHRSFFRLVSWRFCAFVSWHFAAALTIMDDPPWSLRKWQMATNLLLQRFLPIMGRSLI